MKTFLRNIIGVLMLAAIAYLVYNYYGMAQQTVGVQGASTQKAQEITENVQSDLSEQADKAADSASQVTVGEIIGFFTRFQKIPEDINTAREYIEGQVGNLTNKEK